jgi:hypothetical protein
MRNFPKEVSEPREHYQEGEPRVNLSSSGWRYPPNEEAYEEGIRDTKIWSNVKGIETANFCMNHSRKLYHRCFTDQLYELRRSQARAPAC